MYNELSVNYTGQVTETAQAEREQWNKENVTKQVPNRDGAALQFQQEPAADPRLIANEVVYGD